MPRTHQIHDHKARKALQPQQPRRLPDGGEIGLACGAASLAQAAAQIHIDRHQGPGRLDGQRPAARQRVLHGQHLGLGFIGRLPRLSA